MICSTLALLGWTAVANGNDAITYYETALPTTLNPLYAQTPVDHRVHALIFDRLYYRSSIG